MDHTAHLPIPIKYLSLHPLSQRQPCQYALAWNAVHDWPPIWGATCMLSFGWACHDSQRGNSQRSGIFGGQHQWLLGSTAVIRSTRGIQSHHYCYSHCCILPPSFFQVQYLFVPLLVLLHLRLCCCFIHLHPCRLLCHSLLILPCLAPPPCPLGYDIDLDLGANLPAKEHCCGSCCWGCGWCERDGTGTKNRWRGGDNAAALVEMVVLSFLMIAMVDDDMWDFNLKGQDKNNNFTQWWIEWETEFDR